jgi:hypothetical protein
MTATPVTKAALKTLLADKDPKALSAILVAADVAHDGAEEGAEKLAGRLVGALWWRSHSPARQVVWPRNLDQLVNRAERKLKLDLGNGDAWERLAALTDQLIDGSRPLRVDDMAPAMRKRLRRVVWANLLGVGAAGAAAGTRFASLKLLQLAAGPTWRLITMLPKVGPALVAMRVGAGTVAAVSGPVGIALALLTLNSVLGATDDTALPLLLGIGLVCRNPLVVVPDADSADAVDSQDADGFDHPIAPDEPASMVDIPADEPMEDDATEA